MITCRERQERVSVRWLGEKALFCFRGSHWTLSLHVQGNPGIYWMVSGKRDWTDLNPAPSSKSIHQKIMTFVFQKMVLVSILASGREKMQDATNSTLPFLWMHPAWLRFFHDPYLAFQERSFQDSKMLIIWSHEGKVKATRLFFGTQNNDLDDWEHLQAHYMRMW